MPPTLQSPTIRRIIDEAEALTSALRWLRGDGDPADALRRVGLVFPSHEVGDIPIESVIHYSMARILGKAYEPILRIPDPDVDIEGHVFGTIAEAWVWWDRGVDRELAHTRLRKLGVPRATPRQEGGAIHLLAMQPWAKAVDALLRDDHEEAKRQFHRATELGSQNGTPSSQAVQWTFAASYLGR